jgi:hypothetical protein
MTDTVKNNPLAALEPSPESKRSHRVKHRPNIAISPFRTQAFLAGDKDIISLRKVHRMRLWDIVG